MKNIYFNLLDQLLKDIYFKLNLLDQSLNDIYFNLLDRLINDIYFQLNLLDQTLNVNSNLDPLLSLILLS